MLRCEAPDANCEEQFDNNLDLIEHARIAHRIEVGICYTCDEQLFWTNSELCRHHRKFHSGDPSCEFCESGFKTHDHLLEHMKKFHRILTGFHEPPGILVDPPQLTLQEKILKLGLRDDPVFLVDRENYLLNHDHEKLLWGFQVLTPDHVRTNVASPNQRIYRRDPETPYFQPTSTGIHDLGYICGHVIPAADCRLSVQAFDDCMMMGNIVAMWEKFNSGTWYSLETHCRKLTNNWENIPIYTVPIYHEDHVVLESINGCDVHIADEFAKIIVLDQPGMETPLVQVFKIPHVRKLPTGSIFFYKSSLEEIEDLTGIRFLKEGFVNTWDWGMQQTPHICPERLCFKTFLDEDSLRIHSRSHEGKFRCIRCGREFETELERDEHLSTAHPPLECPYCPKTVFYNKSEYEVHVRFHLNDRIYKCKLCPYETASSSALVVHMRTHTGYKPFKCDQCDYAAVTKANLDNHQRHKHTGEMPFECDSCDFKTADPCSLNRHKQNHSADKPFECEHCKYETNRPDHFARHYRMKHPGHNPFKCHLCPNTFPNKTKFNQHLLFDHKVEFKNLPKSSSRSGAIGKAVRSFFNKIVPSSSSVLSTTKEVKKTSDTSTMSTTTASETKSSTSKTVKETMKKFFKTTTKTIKGQPTLLSYITRPSSPQPTTTTGTKRRRESSSCQSDKPDDEILLIKFSDEDSSTDFEEL